MNTSTMTDLSFIVFALVLVACSKSPDDVPAESQELEATALLEATPAILEFPESAVWDEESSAWYVSNFGGHTFVDESGPAPLNSDGNGFITKLRPNGEIETLKWVTGLHAPKGLGVNDGKLYAADVGQIVIIDIGDANIESTIEMPESQFLNGVAVDRSNGDVYVSDMFANKIYRLSAGSGVAELFLDSASLEMPNGLDVDGRSLVVGSWGIITNPATFGTDVKGGVKLVDLETKLVTNIGGPIANVDGIFKFGEDYIVSDWVAGTLMRVSSDGSATLLKAGYNNCADIGFDANRNAVAIPEMSTSGGPGKVSFISLE